jgi:transposase
VRLKPSWEDMAAVMYRAGSTLHEIADRFGVHHTTIWRFLKKTKVKMRPKGRPKTTGRYSR